MVTVERCYFVPGNIYCLGGDSTPEGAGLCSAGFYCPEGSEWANEIVCAASYYCHAGSTTAQGSGQCPAGKYPPNEAKSIIDCLPCTDGYYCPEGSSGSTLQCALGYFCPEGSSDEHEAPNGGICPTGHYCPLGTGDPLPCSAGYFWPHTGGESHNACDQCWVGTYMNNTGATACIPCPAGSYRYHQPADQPCVLCPDGHYCPEGTGDPPLCPEGKYTPAIGYAECIDCEAGSFSNITGATECQKCPLGYESKKGWCSKCDYGFYGDVEGLWECLPCAFDEYQPYEGRSSCVKCNLTSHYRPNAWSCGLCPYQYTCNNTHATPFECFGVPETDKENARGGEKGWCIGSDLCRCENPWMGEKCDEIDREEAEDMAKVGDSSLSDSLLEHLKTLEDTELMEIDDIGDSERAQLLKGGVEAFEWNGFVMVVVVVMSIVISGVGKYTD